MAVNAIAMLAQAPTTRTVAMTYSRNRSSSSDSGDGWGLVSLEFMVMRNLGLVEVGYSLVRWDSENLPY
jgi:hypothetical protein